MTGLAQVVAATDPQSAAAGPLGLVLVLLLGIATVLLVRNMDRRIKRLPREFPDDPTTPTPPEDPAPDRR